MLDDAGGAAAAPSLIAYRNELVERMARLPLTDRRRARLADTIRQIEATIDRLVLDEGG